MYQQQQQQQQPAVTTTIVHEQAPRVELYFRAANLLDTDTFSKSDPYVMLFAHRELANGRRREPLFVGRTEVARDTLNPVWTVSIPVEFHFESRQTFSFEIWDDDGKGPNTGDDFLGRGRFLLSAVVAGRHSTLEIPLTETRGTLWIHAEEPSASGSDTVQITFHGVGLKKMEFFGTADPYYRLYKLLPNGERRLLHQSHTINENLNPQWLPTPALRLTDVTVGNDLENRCLQFECWDDNFISDDKMGMFNVSLQELIDASDVYVRSANDAAASREELRRAPRRPAGRALELPDARGGAGRPPREFTLRHATKDKTYGTIVVPRVTVRHVPTFTEFLGAGLEMNLAVAIDFTASNGDPRNPQSLHYLDRLQRHGGRRSSKNQYQQAIESVCDILMEYDTDKLVPVFGFGAKLPNDPHQSNHCFHLNGQADPHVHDVSGILDAYANALSAVRLSGPTNFAPTIRQATAAARASPNCYTILLILTDGCITDTDRTIDAIVDAGDAPLSIVIVGVGEADFTVMDILDGDDDRLRNRYGKPAARDLVQFVPFDKFKNAPRWALAAEVLEEVPRQVEEWAMLNFIDPQRSPNAPPARSPPVPQSGAGDLL